MALKIALLAGMVAGITSCAIKQPQTTEVYIPQGAIQCETQGMTLADSTRRLASVGVTSGSAQCAEMTGMMFSTVCGAETGGIILHTIPTKEVLLAEKAGYKNAEGLKSASDGVGYAVINCQ
ncbi:hypothetical protein [Enterovibrio nigricans]|nr:hypothetical protein [Enterovibrio nigricans]